MVSNSQGAVNAQKKPCRDPCKVCQPLAMEVERQVQNFGVGSNRPRVAVFLLGEGKVFNQKSAYDFIQTTILVVAKP